MGKSIRRGDRVLVIAGNDRGKSGEVIGRSDDRVLVQGVNIRKKHMKKTQQAQAQGGRVIEMEAPVHVSNVCLCDKDGKRLKEKAVQEKPAKKKAVQRAAKKVKNV